MVLQSIRDRLSGIIAIFIFAILIIPFAFVGVNSYFTSDAVNAVAVVNDEEITTNDFNQAFQDFRRRMQAQMGAAFDPAQFDQPIMRRDFLDRMINERLLAQVSSEAGLAVSNPKLAEAIRSLGAFEVDGQFNPEVYQARLASQGLTPAQFEAQMRNSMIMDQFPETIASSAIATDWEKNNYARLADQTRAFEAVIVPATEEDVAAQAIGEDEIKAWYDAHQDEYLSPEQVVIEYLELAADDLPEVTAPEESVLKARFEEQKSRFLTPEARLASHILIEVPKDAPEVDVETAHKKAQELADRARAGEDFAALAREFSEDVGSAEAGGDLGWVEPGYMVKAFEDALYELTPEHPISDPVRTGFGWHVIELRDIRPAEGMTYEEARDVILSEYQAEQKEREYLEKADRLVDIIYEDPTTLSAAADELGLQIKVAGPFGREGGEGIAANPEVIKAAFSDMVLGEGAASDPIDLGQNHMVVIRDKQHILQKVKPLDEVRDEVVAAIRKQQAMEAASAAADEILQAVEAGQEIAELAQSRGLEVVAVEALARNDAEVDPKLRDEVFRMPVPVESAPVIRKIRLDDGFAVVRLDSVTDGTLSPDDALKAAAYGRRIATATANSEVLGFLKMLRAQSEITVYEDRL